MFLYRDDELELELLEPRHADEMFAAIDANREYLREWLGWLDATQAPVDIETYLKSILRNFGEGNPVESLGIRYRGLLVGSIGLVHVDQLARSTEIGYWLSADAQGKGIMTRACRVLVSHAFDELAMNKVEIRCAVGNQKSRAIPERLGFKEEGTLRQCQWLYDHFVDMVVYGMLADEWRAVR